DRFAVLGYSGGGPYAAATAFALPERLARVAIASGTGPVTSREAWRQMTPREHLTRFAARRAALVQMAMSQTAGQVTTDAEAYLIGRDGITPEVDLEVLRRPTIRAMLKEDLQEAFAQGAGAAAYDIGLLARPWGFPLEQIRV